MLDKERMRPDQ